MLKLLLPVIFPSWRFFSSIGPSPRIHYAFLQTESDEPQEWHEFRPRLEHVSFKESLWRLLHNPRWNETLYINTCAERLFEGHSEMREHEIQTYVASGEPMGKAGAYAVQGGAAAFTAHISGSYTGIMGLPLFETSQLLRAVS